MPRAARFLLLLAAAAAAWLWRAATPADAERLGPCRVTRVVDGDTLRVRCAGRHERVRMLQIDTPEREQALHAEAREALRARLAGREVWLEPWREPRDDHGRLLAYVFAGDENVNLTMIREGWTPHFERYGAGRYAGAFAAAEREARAARRGIWARRPPE
jgi:micrococcal nuclease